MAELTLQERLQPSLLDRLTDDEPGNLKEAAERRVLTLNQLKASVLRELQVMLARPRPGSSSSPRSI